MGYAKVIKYGQQIEIYQYESEPRGFTTRSRKLQAARRASRMALLREDNMGQKERYEGKRKDNARRARMAFGRLVSANLGQSMHPLLVSLTYAENITETRQGHEDFNAFARNLRSRFGSQVRYIAVVEFQKRGAVHFHALLWGLPIGLVKTERHTRLVASLWKQGYADLVETDGSPKLAGYLSKYMTKAFKANRLFGKKAYICSKNLLRPVIEKRSILISHFYENNLSTTQPLQDVVYQTQWLGECRFRHYSLVEKDEPDKIDITGI